MLELSCLLWVDSHIVCGSTGGSQRECCGKHIHILTNTETEVNDSFSSFLFATYSLATLIFIIMSARLGLNFECSYFGFMSYRS